MSTEKRRLPVRCVAHTTCRKIPATGIACAGREVECREFKPGLILVREGKRGIVDSDWHRPCDACLREGAVKDGNEFGKGFMTCCTRQWTEGRWKCKECGEVGIDVAHARLAFDEKTRRQIRQHLRTAPVGERSGAKAQFAGFWCGPLVPDDDCPGYWERFGAGRAGPGL